VPIRERAVDELAHIDYGLATSVAEGIGVANPVPPGGNHKPVSSPALSLDNLRGDHSIRTRMIAVLVTDGVDTGQVTQAREALGAQGAIVEALAPHDGKVRGSDGNGYAVDRALPTVASVLYDAVLLPGGPTGTPDLASDETAMRFVRDAYRHGKAIGALGSGVGMLAALEAEGLHIASGHGHVCTDRGVVTDTTTGATSEEFAQAFAEAIATHRHWDRPSVRC
jgi:catalase